MRLLNHFANFVRIKSHLHRRMPSIVRLGKISGDADQTNEVLFCYTDRDPKSLVIFFGGDVQDYPEKMTTHRDNGRYVNWNLEATARLLIDKYKHLGAAVLVIRPARMHLNTFSSYTNFVQSNLIGIPNHSTGQGSWRQLSLIVVNALLKAPGFPVHQTQDESTPEVSNVSNDTSNGQIQEQQHQQKQQKHKESNSTLQNDIRDPCIPQSGPAIETSENHSCPIRKLTVEEILSIPKHIIGFSKGCIVLNQLIYDLSADIAQKSVTTGESIGDVTMHQNIAIATPSGDKTNQTADEQAKNDLDSTTFVDNRTNMDKTEIADVDKHCSSVVHETEGNSDQLNSTFTQLNGEIMSTFLRSVETITWLDGGHSGGTNTWVKDANVLKNGVPHLINKKLFCHVTPYQIGDTRRPWIGKEYRKFIDILRRLGVNMRTTVHFSNDVPSLENHFKVLEAFKN